MKVFYLDYDFVDYYIWDYDVYYFFIMVVVKILGLVIIGYIVLVLLLSNIWCNYLLLLSVYCGVFLLLIVVVIVIVEYVVLFLVYDRFVDVEWVKVFIVEGKLVYEIYCKEIVEYDWWFILYCLFIVIDFDMGKVVDYIIYVKYNKKGKWFFIIVEGFKFKEVKDIDLSMFNIILWYVILEWD